jgi:hypothetical protein
MAKQVGAASAAEARRFVERHGIVLQAARGPVPSLAEHVAGGPIRGSWWGHPRGKDIYRVTEAVVDSGDVLVCRLVDDKITYVHRRLWPAVVRLAARLPRARLARVWSEHTPAGSHRARRAPFPSWVPDDVAAEAARLSEDDAERALAPWLPLFAPPPPRRARKR